MSSSWPRSRSCSGLALAGTAALLAVAAASANVVDGSRFSPADGLPTAAVRAIVADDAGRLWVGTAAGLRLLAGGRFVVEAAMTDVDLVSRVNREFVNDLAVSPSGEVWVATGGTLHRRAPGGEWQEALGREVGLGGGIGAVLAAPSGEVWAGGNEGGLVRWNGVEWTRVAQSFRVGALALDGDGVLWATGSRDGEVLVAAPGTVDERGLEFGTGGLPAASPQALEAAGDDVWVGTGDGLVHLERGAVVAVYGRGSGLPSPSILSIAPDGAGAAWVGTAEGLARVKGGVVDLGVGIAAGLTGTRIESLELDRAGDLWVGMPTGLVKLPLRSWVSATDPVDGFVSAVGHTADGTGFAVDDGLLYLADGDGWRPVAGLGDRLVTTAAADGSGGILVGTDAGWGTARSGTFTPDARCCSDRVDAILEDAEGRVWVGTGDGVVVVDDDGEAATFRKSTDETGLGQDPVTDIFADTAGTVWVATLNGGATPFTGLQPGPRISGDGTQGGLVSDLVSVGLVTATGDLWLGTRLGLSARVKGEWLKFADVLGGPITALEDAGSGRVWVGTDASGLALVECGIRVGPACAFSGFDETDGLGAPFVTSLASRDGEIWIGTSRGLTRHSLDVAPPVLTLGAVTPTLSADGAYSRLEPGALLVDNVYCDRSCAASPLAHDAGTVNVGLIGTDVEDPSGIDFLVEVTDARTDGSSVVEGPRPVNADAYLQPMAPGGRITLRVVAYDRHFNRSAPEDIVFETAPTPLWLQLWFLPSIVGLGALGAWWGWVRWQRRFRLGYQDALVAFRDADGRLETRVNAKEGSNGWHPAGLQLSRLVDLHDRLRTTDRPDSQLPADLGDELYRTVIGEHGDVLGRAAERALRLALDFQAAPRLEPLPWEVMQGGRELGHLATDGKLALIRRLDPATHGAPAPLPTSQSTRARKSVGLGQRASLVRGRLRILVAWAKPRDRTFVASTEYEAIEEVARRSAGRVEVTLMSVAQRDRLAAELDQDIDIVHFIGHGEMRKGEPVLLFEDEDGWAHAANGSQLAQILGRAEDRTRRPRLVVLSACQSAEEAPGQPASGLAAGLVRAGVVPAAIGMGYVFDMQAASDFSRALYTSLIRHGQVEHAVAIARSSIRTAYGDRTDWLVPRLYARDLGAATFEFVGGGR